MPWIRNGKKVVNLHTIEVVLTTGEKFSSIWLHDIVSEDGKYIQGIDYTYMTELEVR